MYHRLPLPQVSGFTDRRQGHSSSEKKAGTHQPAFSCEILYQESRDPVKRQNFKGPVTFLFLQTFACSCYENCCYTTKRGVHISIYLNLYLTLVSQTLKTRGVCLCFDATHLLNFSRHREHCYLLNSFKRT